MVTSLFFQSFCCHLFCNFSISARESPNISANEKRLIRSIQDHGKNLGILHRKHFVETPGSFPVIRTEVYDYSYKWNQSVISVETSEIFSGSIRDGNCCMQNLSEFEKLQDLLRNSWMN